MSSSIPHVAFASGETVKNPTHEEQRELVKQWEATGRELERLRREALRNMPYNWTDVDALLELGAHSPSAGPNISGLVEMQRHFIKAHTRR
jgi:hypothetical protein